MNRAVVTLWLIVLTGCKLEYQGALFEFRGPQPPDSGTPGSEPDLGIPVGPCDVDTDGDGYVDCLDPCPTMPDQDIFETELEGCPAGDLDEDGVVDFLDPCPFRPEDADHPYENWEELHDGCPVDAFDADIDRVHDHLDACPQVPEDMDGIQDADGCPETDADGDGMLDVADLCPTMAEDLNGWQDVDGCPEGGAPPDAATPDAATPDAATPDAAIPDASPPDAIVDAATDGGA